MTWDSERREYKARARQAPNGWPFDAVRDDPLTALRIAVTTAYPEWSYLVAFDKISAARPTDAEARMLASYLAEYKSRYNESYRAFLDSRPLDVDGGANTVIFHKYGEGDWAYRRRTWTGGGGPTFVPLHPNVRATHGYTDVERGTFTLEQIMDRAHNVGNSDGSPAKSWAEWKASHPHAFPQEVPA